MSDENNPNRRYDDDENVKDEIHELIMQAESPRDKAELLILLRISQNLSKNTQLTEKLSHSLDAHVERFVIHEREEMALINQGRGFLRAMVIGLALFQGVVVYAYTQHMTETKKMQEDLVEFKKFIAEHTAHHKEERETYKAWMKQEP